MREYETYDNFNALREAIEEKLSFDNPTSIEILMKQRDKLEEKRKNIENTIKDYDEKI